VQLTPVLGAAGTAFQQQITLFIFFTYSATAGTVVPVLDSYHDFFIFPEMQRRVYVPNNVAQSALSSCQYIDPILKRDSFSD